MRVLGIETSCDETGAAVYDSERGLLAHTLYSQVSLHAEYGGVVPEIASRDHVRKILPLIGQCLADVTVFQLAGLPHVDHCVFDLEVGKLIIGGEQWIGI